MAEKRLYIGGLFPDVKEADIADRFSRFGDVKSIEIKVRKADHGNFTVFIVILHYKICNKMLLAK